MEGHTPPKGAATSGPTNLNGTGPGAIPDQGPLDPEEANALNRARVARDVQAIRQGVDRIGPAVFVIAYFSAMACLFLAIIARRLGK